MSINPAAHQAHAYTIITPVYEGPLDLLLQLIERAELDITRLALALVTDQYLEHIRSMEDLPAEEVSAFLVIAARLLQIKSEALLPRPPVREAGEEDPAEALARQLIAYRRFRLVADLLLRREEAGLHTYLRLAPVPRMEGALDLSGLGLPDLLEAARAIYGQGKPPLATIVAPPRITIREKIQLIARILRQAGRSTFGALLGNHRTRMDAVVTFLAMLELVKRRLVLVQQAGLFGEITLEPAETWNPDEELDTEFGE